MFSRTSIIGNSDRCWKIRFTGRRLGGTPSTDLPRIRISPLVGSRNPAIMRSRVVLPQPEGPRMEKKLPFSTSKPT